MEVKLIAHSQLTDESKRLMFEARNKGATDGKLVAFTAIRNCYSHLKPTEIVKAEGHRYLNKPATDGKQGNDMDRLIRHIIHSGHTSTMEHISFTFALENVSRSLMAQITRHRVGWSFSIESQRYVNYGSNGKAGGINYVIPENFTQDQREFFIEVMHSIQDAYDILIAMGAKPEDARAVLPQAVTTNIVVTCNATSFLSFYNKRKPGTHAQKEIQLLAQKMKDEIVKVEPWMESYFV